MTDVKIHPSSNFPALAYSNLTNRLYEKIQPRHQHFDLLTHTIEITSSNQTVGLVSIYDNPMFREVGIIGQFEAIEDQKVISLLLHNAEKLIKKQNKKSMVGPMNGSTWHPYRFRIHPRKSFFSEFVHKDYYLKAWKEFGFGNEEIYLSNLAPIYRNLNMMDNEDFHIKHKLRRRSFSMKGNDLNLIYDFCNRNFVHSPWFSHISNEEFISIYQDIIPFLDFDLIDMVFDENELVGFLLAIPDHYQKDRVVVKTVVRHPSQKYRGLARLMLSELCAKAQEKGFEEMIHAYIHHDNISANISQKLGGQPYQEYALLSKSI